MAYVYNDWATYPNAVAQLARLNLHIAEVSLQMGPDVSSDGKSRNTGSLSAYLNTLLAQRDMLMADPSVSNSVIQRARLGRTR